MVMIQDGPLPTGADKPLRISGDPYKVQVRGLGLVAWWDRGRRVTWRVLNLTWRCLCGSCSKLESW